MKKKDRARVAIEHKLKSGYRLSFRGIRALFGSGDFWRDGQELSDSTIRRALFQLEEEGLIETRWKCIYPRFFLVYYWIGEL